MRVLLQERVNFQATSVIFSSAGRHKSLFLTMATDFILSIRAQRLVTSPGHRGLGPLFHSLEADRRTTGGQRARERFHVVERFEDEAVALHRLVQHHAGAKIECPHGLGRERGLEGGRNRGLRRDSPGRRPFPLESRHNQRVVASATGSSQNPR